MVGFTVQRDVYISVGHFLQHGTPPVPKLGSFLRYYKNTGNYLPRVAVSGKLKMVSLRACDNFVCAIFKLHM